MVLNMSDFKYVRVLNIRRFLLIWQGSEYASGCNYGRVLRIPGIWVCDVSACTSVAQGFEYVWIMLYGRVLNMPGQSFLRFLLRFWNIWKLWFPNFTGHLILISIKRILPPPELFELWKYMPFLKRMLIHGLY